MLKFKMFSRVSTKNTYELMLAKAPNKNSLFTNNDSSRKESSKITKEASQNESIRVQSKNSNKKTTFILNSDSIELASSRKGSGEDQKSTRSDYKSGSDQIKDYENEREKFNHQDSFHGEFEINPTFVGDLHDIPNIDDNRKTEYMSLNVLPVLPELPRARSGSEGHFSISRHDQRKQISGMSNKSNPNRGASKEISQAINVNFQKYQDLVNSNLNIFLYHRINSGTNESAARPP